MKRTRLPAAIAIILAAILLAAPSCQTGPETATPETRRGPETATPETRRGPETATPETRRGPETVASESRDTLTREQAERKAREYLALNLWAETSHRTAISNPGNFHRVLLGEPGRACAGRPWDPEQAGAIIGQLLDCAAGGAAPESSQRWEDLGAAEREARARRALALLWESTDPSGMVSARLAAERRLEVNPRNNPQFANFAAAYRRCRETEKHTAALAVAGAPEEAALAWLEAKRELEECASAVTGELFPFR